MSEDSEKFSIDPRQRKGNKSFEWIGTNLAKHAWEVAVRVFDHLGISDQEQREAWIERLLDEIRDSGFRPGTEVEPIELRQGEVQIKEQRERHADLALRHAVVVYDEYEEGRAPVTRPPEGQLDKHLELTFQRMQSSLLQAQRHLTALDILKNLEKNTMIIVCGPVKVEKLAPGHGLRRIRKRFYLQWLRVCCTTPLAR